MVYDIVSPCFTHIYDMGEAMQRPRGAEVTKFEPCLSRGEWRELLGMITVSIIFKKSEASWSY